MNRDDALGRVEAIVVKIAGPHRTPADVGVDTALGEGGFWLDSLGLLEVIIACEDEFGIVFGSGPDFNPESLRSLGSLAELVRRKS